ncbi:MAG: flavodoxin-dependent (E)-4-hydroxy-3-methylbut-2-enyl-diphosphate synthase, partial [Alistipes sp.]|nr:flavodoxin-dependent (E)-4-hydroxy-3-methylbut-2-enyl-diphosphate synthase [Alistipes sp.]
MQKVLKYTRRKAHEVRIAGVKIGGENPIAVQSMTNTPTADVERSVEQTKSIADAGAEIVRLTAQGRREGEALAPIVERLRADGYTT